MTERDNQQVPMARVFRPHGFRPHLFRPNGSRAASRAGFSLVELLVALAIFTIVLVGALLLLDATNRVTRTQLGRADLQQAIRVAQDDMIRNARMAGRGGLKDLERLEGAPKDPEQTIMPAVDVWNNVAASTRSLPAQNLSPLVVEDTDVLVVRGLFDSPLYYGDFNDTTSFEVDLDANTGFVEIKEFTKINQFEQDIDRLDDQRTETVQLPEAVILVSPFDEDVYGVAEVDWANSEMLAATATEPARFKLAFRFEDDETTFDPLNPSSRVQAYSALSSDRVFPGDTLARTGFKAIGILEEYRYFIRDDETDNFRDSPKLARTRSMPNWDQLWTRKNMPEQEDYYEDISYYVIDLQVALGFSDTSTGSPTNGEVIDNDDNTDQWFRNAPGDSELPEGDLTVMRISALARTALVERSFEALEIERLEDRTYTTDDVNSGENRRHHRFFLETTIALRNL